jgi:chemotaxis protein MotB
MARSSKRRRRGHEDGHPDERWLLTYADMITLLMALFMVLFSISSVNTSKFESLQRALQDAFSGRILPGGKAIKESGGSSNVAESAPSPPFPSLQPFAGGNRQEAAAQSGEAARREQESFRRLKIRIDALVRSKGLSGKIQTRLTDQGLAVRLLTDDLLFDSGQATPRQDSLDLMRGLGRILGEDQQHSLVVSGHTDTVPIHNGAYPTNWELSTARAASVVRTFAGAGVNPGRMTAAGRAYLQPVAPNTSAAGRSLNRRVEILLPRLVPGVPAKSPARPSSSNVRASR